MPGQHKWIVNCSLGTVHSLHHSLTLTADFIHIREIDKFDYRLLLLVVLVVLVLLARM